MLPQLEAILAASTKVASHEVIDNDPIDEQDFLFKIRCELTTGQVLQIRLRGTGGSVRYSYQEFADRPLRRWDNAPHFANLPSFPHHYHDLEGNIVASFLTGDPVIDLQRVLDAL
ncbi:MAG: DUF6516 family protein [Chloroflexi bacterium]|nr:DUF6516 family protein [Chloroflexota bacterium]